ncbi:MAG: glycine--tRNA ligase subunit beta [Pseudohongiellaceae bacterium]
MTTRDFLVEIGTEELPPKALASLSAAFESNVREALDAAKLSYDVKASTRYATPRRLALLVKSLQAKQADRQIEKVGPAVSAAFDDSGVPTKAAQGFARSCGVDVEALNQVKKDGVDKLAYTVEESGQETALLLPGIIAQALARLPIPKRMRWGSSRAEFIRPVHWVLMLFGKDVVPAIILGVESGNTTRGHRFHHNKAITVTNPADYEKQLESVGHVIANFDKRRRMIRKQVLATAEKQKAQVEIEDDLLDEVTALVEWPVALTGKFDKEFLDMPAEALILTMKTHQKCFCLQDKQGNLLPSFIIVSNIKSTDSAQVIEGNERVIRPRLADACFFYDTDRQQSLESRREQLKQIVFQEKLGSVYDKSVRVATLAKHIAKHLNPRGNDNADVKHCQRAAALSKCDLVTNMVRESPGLQGTMGYHYALLDGEPEQVAKAIDEQYRPRFAGGQLPESITGSVLALAEKLDTIVGLFAIGQPPTGSKDPFALRRAAIGVLRILVEKEYYLNIYATIKKSASAFAGVAKPTNGNSTDASLTEQVFDFLLERSRVWYKEQGIPVEIFLAVQAVKPLRPLDFDRRVQAVQIFAGMPEAASLVVANKRVSNILTEQVNDLPDKVDELLLTDKAERTLFKSINECKKVMDGTKTTIFQIEAHIQVGHDDYSHMTALLELADMRKSVDRFFDKVLVMCEDKKIRRNRLALLNELRNLFLLIADISYLHQTNEDNHP